MIFHVENGFCVEQNDSEKMEKCIMELYYNEEMRKAIVARAK